MLQREPSPPHTMHLSNFFLEPMIRSQPAWIQRPWTQTEEVSGEQGGRASGAAVAPIGKKADKESRGQANGGGGAGNVHKMLNKELEESGP